MLTLLQQAEETSREDLALEYLEQLPYEPYPFQEEAILSWFSSKQGVLVRALPAWAKRSSRKPVCTKP